MRKLKESPKPVHLRKHVAAVHIGSVGFNLLHRKAINAAIWFAQQEAREIAGGDLESYLNKTDGIEVNHSINFKEFRQYINYNSNDHEYLKNIFRDLSQLAVEFDLIEGRRSWEIMPFLSYVKFANGMITWSFRSEIRRSILDPDVYAKINSEIVNQIQNDIAFALYENTYRYVNIGKTPWLKINTLRQLLGIAKDAYKETKYLTRVLKQSMKQIQKVAGITLEMEPTGKPIKAVRFLVRANQQPDLLIEQHVVQEQSDVEAQLSHFGFTPNQIADIFNAYPLDYIQSKINFLNKRARAGGIRNFAAFAYKAFEDDYVENTFTPKLSKSESMPALTAKNSRGDKMSFIEIFAVATPEEKDSMKRLFESAFRASQPHSLTKREYDYAYNQLMNNDWSGAELKKSFEEYVEGYVFMRATYSSEIRSRLKSAAK